MGEIPIDFLVSTVEPFIRQFFHDVLVGIAVAAFFASFRQ
jgi:hypothetical protein